MKKSMSRILALLLTLMLLISAVPAAFAEEIIELGNKDSVEELLFEQVKAAFPSVDVEKQYVYAGYYENKNLSEKVDELLKTLDTDQLVAFTNFKAKQKCTCYDENKNLICAGAESCTCLCHKIDAFTAQMDALIAELQGLDIEEARAYIYALRFDEVIDWMVAQGLRSENPPSPDVTIGSGGYEASLPEEEPVEEEPVAIAEIDEGETKSEGQQAADKYNQLQEENGNESDIGTAIGEALKNYVNTESAFTSLYTQDADFASYVAAQSGENAGLLTAALNDDIMLLSSQVSSEDFHEISGADIDDKITVKLFNYNKENLSGVPLRFSQAEGYGGADSSVDGTGTAGGTITAAPELSATLKDGYPYAEDEGGGSLRKLFDSPVVTMTTNSGLFQYKESTGTYSYDSKYNAAWYNENTKRFVLYNSPVCPSYTPGNDNTSVTAVQAGNFLPFNRLINDDGTLNVTYYANKNTSYDTYALKGKVDLWFGVMVEFDFYMPEGGKYKGNDMTFEFLGDDDVWLFIDDVLVMDLGGTHGAINGAVRFSNGNCYSSENKNGGTLNETYKIADLFKDAGKYDSTEWQKVQDYSVDANGDVTLLYNDDGSAKMVEIFKDYTKHTFKFFYLERGGNISYCSMKFNIPTLPKGGLTVEKKTDGNQTETTTAAEYTFQLTKQEDSSAIASATYKLLNSSGTEIGSGTTDKNGKFKLKAGQKAHFEALDSQTYCVIKEEDHTYTDSNQTKFIITDEYNKEKETAGSSAVVYVSPKQTSGAEVVFTNTLKTTSLTVKKEAVNLRDEDKDKTFKFEAGITDVTEALTSVTDSKGKIYQITNGKFSFELNAGKSITFTGLPIGAKVEITEVDNGSFKISDFKTSVTAENVKDEKLEGYTYSGTLEGTAGSTITFTNELNRFPLTIQKEGLEAIDENQSTLYRVTGNGVNLTVAIKGNGSVTINDLLAGDYKVEELTDWSWRYTKKSVISSDNETDGTVKVDSTDNWIKFTNDRTEDKWLDGDCYSENKFTTVSSGEQVPDSSDSAN